MTDVDWSKAPEGAQYYSASDDGFYTFYRNIKESTYEIFYCGGTRWVLQVGTPEEHCTSIPRPPQAWNGEGLPPVGTVCEVNHDGRLYETIIIGFDPDDASAVFKTHSDYATPYDGYIDPYRFRPIRTPEQVAADERMHGMADILKVSLGRIDVIGAAYLYDAGYRKPC